MTVQVFRVAESLSFFIYSEQPIFVIRFRTYGVLRS